MKARQLKKRIRREPCSFIFIVGFGEGDRGRDEQVRGGGRGRGVTPFPAKGWEGTTFQPGSKKMFI
jgi:hypothetical protein